MKKFLFLLAFFSISLFAEGFTVDLGHPTGSSAAKLIQTVFVIGILTLAPSIAIMTTSFTRIVIVFSFLRNALGLQQSPPNVVLVSLALFLSIFIMGPTIDTAYENGIKPLIEEKINEEQAFTKITEPLKTFMLKQTRENEIKKFIELSKAKNIKNISDIPLKALIPAFMISEIKKAFEMGFLIFLPFLVIDMIVSSILMAMGMMMLPPVMISLPFKIIFFVLIDGWSLLSESLVKSFNM